MSCATADAAASIQIEECLYRNRLAHDASVIERYAGKFAKHRAVLSDTKPETALREVAYCVVPGAPISSGLSDFEA
jgi:hypothetical protein